MVLFSGKLTQWSAASDRSYYYFDEFCISTDSLFSLNFTTEVMHDVKPNEFIVYPNPSNGYLFFSNELIETSVFLYNVLGQEIKKYYFKKENSFKADLEDGIYYLKLETKQNISVRKIIIKNQ